MPGPTLEVHVAVGDEACATGAEAAAKAKAPHRIATHPKYVVRPSRTAASPAVSR
jgi:hypothetical protein